MTENTATRKRVRRPRSTRYPEHLTIMLTEEQRDAIDAAADARDTSIGEVVRAWIDLGREAEAAAAQMEVTGA